jgi:hypothetical protein
LGERRKSIEVHLGVGDPSDQLRKVPRDLTRFWAVNHTPFRVKQRTTEAASLTSEIRWYRLIVHSPQVLVLTHLRIGLTILCTIQSTRPWF